MYDRHHYFLCESSSKKRQRVPSRPTRLIKNYSIQRRLCPIRNPADFGCLRKPLFHHFSPVFKKSSNSIRFLTIQIKVMKDIELNLVTTHIPSSFRCQNCSGYCHSCLVVIATLQKTVPDPDFRPLLNGISSVKIKILDETMRQKLDKRHARHLDTLLSNLESPTVIWKNP